MKKTIITLTLILTALFATACSNGPDKSLCGNGKKDEGEICDTQSAGADNCITKKDSCQAQQPQGDKYYTWKINLENACDSKCVLEKKTCSNSQYDGICPQGCTSANDYDCAKIGDPCTDSSQCKSKNIIGNGVTGNGVCIEETSSSISPYKGGYCSYGCQNGTCTDGSICINNSQCMKKCNANSDCRKPDYECNTAPGSGTDKVCISVKKSLCNTNAECKGTPPSPYNAWTCHNSFQDSAYKDCYPSYNGATKADGKQCSNDNECQGVYAVCAKASVLDAIGICSTSCNDKINTFDPSTEACVGEKSQSAGIVAKKCTPGSTSACSTGRFCTRYYNGEDLGMTLCLPSTYNMMGTCTKKDNCGTNPRSGLDSRACIEFTKIDNSTKAYACSLTCIRNEDCPSGCSCTNSHFCVVRCTNDQDCPSSNVCKGGYCVPK